MLLSNLDEFESSIARKGTKILVDGSHARQDTSDDRAWCCRPSQCHQWSPFLLLFCEVPPFPSSESREASSLNRRCASHDGTSRSHLDGLNVCEQRMKVCIREVLCLSFGNLSKVNVFPCTWTLGEYKFTKGGASGSKKGHWMPRLQTTQCASKSLLESI
jgi:hypothetical protein